MATCRETIKARRSARKYAEGRVADDEVAAIVEAAVAAPSAMNAQPWAFVVARDAKRLRALAAREEHYRALANADCALLVCAEPARAYRGFWPQDCAAAVENALLAARELGVGAVWMGVHPEPELEAMVGAEFGLPAGIVPFALVALGRLREEDARSGGRERKPPVVWAESWGREGR